MPCWFSCRNTTPSIEMPQHTRLQPFLDQADDPLVANSAFDQSYEPFRAQRIEEARYVGVEDPVDFACLDSIRERIQRVMLATSGPEPVAEPQEFRLVDRRKERHHRCLDDLVLDGGDAERPLFAVRLRYVPPARGQCPIGAPMDARVQISEVSVKVCPVALPCHAVDTQLHVCGPAPVTRLPGSAFGPCFAVPHFSRSRCFPPPAPPRGVPLCSPASQVLSASLTSSSRSSSATASGLPDAALELPPRAVTKISRFPRKRCAYMQRV